MYSSSKGCYPNIFRQSEYPRIRSFLEWEIIFSSMSKLMNTFRYAIMALKNPLWSVSDWTLDPMATIFFYHRSGTATFIGFVLFQGHLWAWHSGNRALPVLKTPKTVPTNINKYTYIMIKPALAPTCTCLYSMFGPLFLQNPMKLPARHWWLNWAWHPAANEMLGNLFRFWKRMSPTSQQSFHSHPFSCMAGCHFIFAGNPFPV